VNNTIPSPKRTRRKAKEVLVAVNRKFTRIPKTTELVAAGVPTEAIPTYCCLADYANNKTGLCWPKMETLATILNRSVRTVQRHLHLLREAGVIEFVERRRWKGRFSSYTYKILHIVTTGHGRRMDKRRTNKRRTKPVPTTPKSPSKDTKDGYWWLFGDKAPLGEQEESDRWEKMRKEDAAKRRTDGYEWLFK
jgi:DNA-binding transcriptional ArsR family regulator